WGGSTTSEVGEDASTIAGCPAIVTRLASASPQKLLPKNSKRSVNEATCGADETWISAAAASPGDRIAVATRPVRPAIEPKITPGLSGATKSALPVASVVNRSPFEKFTVTPGVSRPFTSSTASVARSPETILRGSSSIRALDAAGGSCCAQTDGPKIPAMRQTIRIAGLSGRKGMRGIVVENLMLKKAMHASTPEYRATVKS